MSIDGSGSTERFRAGRKKGPCCSKHHYCRCLPSLAIRARQVIVGGGGVGDAHVVSVVVNFGSGAEGDYSKEHHLRQARGILEGTGGRGLALGGIHPV